MNHFKLMESLGHGGGASAAKPAPVPMKPHELPIKEVGRPAGLPESNHYASRSRALMELEYEYLWPKAVLTGPMADDARQHADWILKNRARLEAFTKKYFPTMPFHVPGIINVLESGLDFNGTLLNGDDFTRKTVHFPSGHGPWKSWEEAAVYAFNHEAEGWHWVLSKWNWNDVGAYFWLQESWNGHDARLSPQYELTTPKGASPYVYSGTQFYVKGKKQENPSRFSKDLVSAQPGCMAILKALELSGVKVFV